MRLRSYNLFGINKNFSYIKWVIMLWIYLFKIGLGKYRILGLVILFE